MIFRSVRTVRFAQAYRRSLRPYSNSLMLMESGQSPVPGFTFREVPGHTPGHMVIDVTYGTDRLIVAGDSFLTQVRNKVQKYAITYKLFHLAGKHDNGKRKQTLTFSILFLQPDQINNPEWGFGLEFNSTQAFSTRMPLLDELANNRTLTISYHEAFPGLGHIRKLRGNSFDWVPAVPQLIGTGVSRTCASFSASTPFVNSTL